VTIITEHLNPYAAKMYEQMEAMGREKWAGYKIHLLKKWFPVTRLQCPAYVGAFTLSSPETKQRWFLSSDAIPFADTWVSPADLARLYLQIKWGGKKRRINTAQWKNFYETNRSMPLWASPVYMDNAYYIDIRSAYWSILRAVGWDLQYTPGKVLSINDPITVNDFPFDTVKMARNCLISISADGSKNLRYWNGQKMEVRRSGNGLVNRMLWSFVCDVLNGVAWDCYRAGAVYGFTDGFIFPAHRVEAGMAAIEAWGLPTSVKFNGECEISGPGAYKFPGRVTGKFLRQREHTFHKINPVSVDWLRDRFGKAARYNRIMEPFDADRYQARIAKMPSHHVKHT
jgi:hypothetical protein